MKTISLEEAKKQGLKRYFTGEPCKHGHVSERLVSNRGCCECAKARYRKAYANNPDFREKVKSNTKYRYEKDQNYRDRCKSKALEKHYSEYANDPNYREYKKQKAAQWIERKRLEDPNFDKKMALYKQKWERDKYANDPYFRTKKAVRAMLKRVLRNTNSEKLKSTDAAHGYSPEELKRHIESQFAPGMSWENHGEWHIDHIVPVSYFIENGEKDPSVINALENLQPMWADENMAKSNKMELKK